MIAIDWDALMLGAAVGAGAGALFFAGLAVSVRMAMRRASRAPLLALSAGVRIAALLALAWGVSQTGGAPAAIGFGVGFLGARWLALALARSPAPLPRRLTPWS